MTELGVGTYRGQVAFGSTGKTQGRETRLLTLKQEKDREEHNSLKHNSLNEFLALLREEA